MAFYRKLLKGLVDVPMDQESLNALKGMSDLSPGDFKVVRDRHSFYPGKEVNHRALVQALQQKAKTKKVHRGDKQIGF